MGTINLINGGLDIQGIVDNLIYVQREPIRRLEEQSKTYQDRVSAYQAFNTKLLAFKASVENLLYQGDEVPFSFPSSFEERLNHSVFALRTAQSSDEAVLTATASKGAMVGDFTVSVSRLAKFDTYASNNFASDTGTATQTGAIVIQQGDADPVTVTVDDTNNTLQGIRDAINRASAGVRATIVRDGSASPYRLVLTSSESGTANALTITNNLNQGSGQAVAFNRTVAAEDAALQVNGIEIVSTSNTVTDAIEGVTLNLRAASGTAVVTVGRDLDSIVAALKDFAAKYNDVAGYISSQFSYDATEKKAGLLAGDFTLRRAQGMISSTLMGTINSDGAALRLLAQVGLKRNSDGTLTVDEAKLEQALESDLRGTAHVFLADAQDAAGATVSIAPQLFNQLKSLTDGLEGPVFRAQDAVQQGIMRINRQIEQMEERLEKQREILIAQFAKADEALRQLNVLQTSLNSQINALQGLA